jgi:hypothetical protein
MKRIMPVVFGLLCLVPAAFADGLVSPVVANCSSAAECVISGVNLTASVTSQVQGRTASLKLLGAGLRKKQVAVAQVSVYVGQLFANDPSKFVRTSDGALASLDAESTVALTMTFLRDVSVNQVQTAFQDALAANNVDQTQADIVSFLNAVEQAGDAKNGLAITIIGEKLSDGTEVVTYSGTQGGAVSMPGPAGFVSQVMSIWLGTPSDTDLGNAKNDMLIDRNLTN